MQDDVNARIARLEQILDEMQAENAKLKDDLEDLRTALRTVVMECFGVLDGIERQTEAGKMRLERGLGRQVTKTSNLIDELSPRKVAS